jgi:hypothetical protein
MLMKQYEIEPRFPFACATAVCDFILVIPTHRSHDGWFRERIQSDVTHIRSRCARNLLLQPPRIAAYRRQSRSFNDR